MLSYLKKQLIQSGKPQKVLLSSMYRRCPASMITVLAS